MEFKISELTPLTSKEVRSTKETEVSDDFEFTLKRIGSKGLMERLDSLITEITSQGNKIVKNQNIEDLQDYRGLIQEFINEVVTNSHEFSRENFLDRRGRHRVYGLVKVVNQELDDLAQDLLKKEKDHLAILDRTDNIRGLLLDMMI